MPERQDESSLPAAEAEGPDILARIVESKRGEVDRLRALAGELKSRAMDSPPPRDFLGALSRPDRVSLIAEVKRRSPGAGPIRTDLDPAALASAYGRAGASAISVLTDGPFFGGSLEDLTAVRGVVSLPTLRKDFTIAEEQIWEGRAAGADAILLIVRILEDQALVELREAAEEVGMSALVEVHDGAELQRAVSSGASLIGINNRDLATFVTRIETTLELVPSVPHGTVLVSESGIRSRDDSRRLGEAGVDAVLVGEALLRAADPERKARELAGGSRTAGRPRATGTTVP